MWDLSSGQCRAVHPENSPDARSAWELVRPDVPLADLSPGWLFLEVREPGSDEVTARFPLGNFNITLSDPLANTFLGWTQQCGSLAESNQSHIP